MTLAASVRQSVSAGRFDEVEDQWLSQLDTAPDDVDFFAELATALADRGESERLASLLELADEHLQASASWEARLELLRRVALHFLAAERIHPEIVATLERLYPESPSFAGLAEYVGLFKAVNDLEKSWTKVDRLRSLLAYEVGSVVWMEGKGAGRVAEVNLALSSFRVDFDGGVSLTVGFGGAAKLLQAVPAGHVIHRRVTEPDTLAELKQSDPAELLRLVLSSYDRPLTAGEVREVLGNVVAEPEWASWWGAARRHPQLVVTGKGSRQRYAWASSTDAALADTARRFARAAPGDKLAIYRKNASRDAGLRRTMEEALAELGEQLAAEQPAQAIAVWGELARCGAAPEGAAWSPQALIGGTSNPAGLVLEIDDRTLRAEAVALVRELHDDWPEQFMRLLSREPDPRILDQLAGELEASRPALLAGFYERVLNEPRKLPAALVWLGERAAGELELAPRQALKLLQRLLVATRYPPFAPLRARLQKLYEAGGPFPRLIAALDEELAATAAQAVARAPVEHAERQALTEALELRFASLRRGATVTQALHALPASIDAKRAELKRLLEEELPANRRAIETAREMGDLRENFEYKAARQRHEYLTSRAEGLQRDLARARPIEPPEERPETVRIGCRVDLETAAGERPVTLLGPWESDPERAVVSYESELGQQLLGRRVDDRISLPDGEARVLRIRSAVEP